MARSSIDRLPETQRIVLAEIQRRWSMGGRNFSAYSLSKGVTLYQRVPLSSQSVAATLYLLGRRGYVRKHMTQKSRVWTVVD